MRSKDNAATVGGRVASRWWARATGTSKGVLAGACIRCSSGAAGLDAGVKVAAASACLRLLVVALVVVVHDGLWSMNCCCLYQKKTKNACDKEELDGDSRQAVSSFGWELGGKLRDQGGLVTDESELADCPAMDLLSLLSSPIKLSGDSDKVGVMG